MSWPLNVDSNREKVSGFRFQVSAKKEDRRQKSECGRRKAEKRRLGYRQAGRLGSREAERLGSWEAKIDIIH